MGLSASQISGEGVLGLQGDAGKGKTTIAYDIAPNFGAQVHDTSHAFRALTALLFNRKIRPDDQERVEREAQMSFSTLRVRGDVVRLGGIDLSDQLRSAQTNAAVAMVASYPEVRAQYRTTMQRLVASRQAVVVGRHIHEVWPDAIVLEIVRFDGVTEAARLMDEGHGELASMALRVEQDRRNRTVALRDRDSQPITVDTTGLTKAEQAELITIMAFAAGFRLASSHLATS